MLGHRIQVLLDQERYEKVAEEAERRGKSMGAVIREAIDLLPADPARRHEAVAAILAAEPMDLPRDPTELRRELDSAHDRIST